LILLKLFIKYIKGEKMDGCNCEEEVYLVGKAYLKKQKENENKIQELEQKIEKLKKLIKYKKKLNDALKEQIRLLKSLVFQLLNDLQNFRDSL